VAASPTGPEAGYVYVLNSVASNVDSTVSVINTNTIVDIINTGGMAGGGVAGVAVSPTGPEAGDIYVANPGSDTVSVISPLTN
jgi:DNA-binding beta-propeller fold protein YncE